MPAFSRPDRARLYRSIAQLSDAGVPMNSLVVALGRSFTSLAGRAVVRRIQECAIAGNPISEAILRSSDLGFPKVHGILIKAAERSGDLARPLHRLALADELAERRRRELLQGAAYPLLLVHAAIFAPAAAQLVSAPLPTLASLLAIVIPIDALIFVLYRAIATPRESPRLARCARWLPPIDRLAHDRSAASFLSTTHSLYEAGIPLLAAAREAGDVVPHDDLRRIYVAAADSAVSAGSSFSDLLARLPLRRVEVIGTLTVAETAGTLGDALRDTANLLEETAAADQARLVKRTLSTLLTVAMAYAAYRILAFWSDYYGRLANIR